MNNQKGYALIDITLISLILIGAWGWVWNLVKIFDGTFDPLSGLMVLRVIGVFVAPLGCIVGFL